MNIKLWIVALASTITLTANAIPKNTQVGSLNVIPQPQSVTLAAEKAPFVIGKKTTIHCEPSLLGDAQFLAASIKEATGLTLKISHSTKLAKSAIVLKIDNTVSHPEGYVMEVNERTITISGATADGVFYGIQTLFKSLPATIGTKMQAAVPAGVVKDYPRFAYRGFLIDVGRHFFSVDYLKQIIDMLALHNINHFHWHLTEDQGWRIEIKKYPRLIEVGSVRKRTLIDRATQTFDETPHSGYYTQDEAREIVRYAAERHITVIPEIDMPGHMLAALASYPELGCTGGPYEIPAKWGVFADVLCGGNDQALQFAKDVLEEIMDIFPSEYIHIGGDECPKKKWKECPKCQAKIKELGIVGTEKHSAENQLQTYFMSEVGKVIAARGRKMMGWDEMLEGGLAPGATVMSWTGIKGGIETARLGHNAIMTPIQYLYFSNPTYNRIRGAKSLERVYTYEPVPSQLEKEEERKHIIGAQGCIWTEWTRDSLKMEWQLLPRLAALSEIQWAEASRKDFDSFLTRLPSLLDIYTRRGYDFRRDIFEPVITVTPNVGKATATIDLSTFDGAKVYYTLDGTQPSLNSTAYTQPFEIASTTLVSAIAVRGNDVSEQCTEPVDFNLATMRPGTLVSKPHKSYTADGYNTLIDGLHGDLNYRSGRWVGVYGTDAVIDIDLQESRTISSAFVGELIITGDAIFGCTGIEVEVSADGKEYQLAAQCSFPVVEKGAKLERREQNITFSPVETRYVRIRAKVTPQLPEWHSMPGKKAFLFLDEVGVR